MAKLEFNSAHIWTANPVDGQPLDLSGYVSSIEASHDDDEAASKAVWGDYVAGLPTASITLNNVDGHLAAFDSPLFGKPEGVPMRVTIPSMASRWDRFKYRLHRIHVWRWYPLSWIPLRWVDYHFHADLWPTEDGFAGHAVGPITKGLEER